MPELAPDVTLAVELIETWNVRWWEGLADGLLQPTPCISAARMERLEEFQAWAASHCEAQDSYVQSAITNLARVADDVSGVFDYEAEYRDRHYLARPWYRDFHGANRLHEVEDWQVHVLLIHNLAIELIRAVNLILVRARQAAPIALTGQALAVMAVGPRHAPMKAATYAESERQGAQPYPGLRAFPEAIPQRELGGFGTHSDDTPRDLAEFQRWVDKVEARGGAGSPSPPQGSPPFSLPPPVGRQPSTTPNLAQLPRPVYAAYGVLALFALLVGFVAYPWFAGAAIGAALVTWRFHLRIWKWRPDFWPTVLALAVAGILGALVQLGVDRLDGSDSGQPPVAQVGTPEAQRSIDSQSAWEPELEGGLEAFNETYGKHWGTSIDFDAQDQLLFKFRLHNPSEETTPFLDVQAAWREPIEGLPWVVEMLVGPRRELRPVPSASVSLHPQSRGVSFLSLWRFIASSDEEEGEEGLEIEASYSTKLGASPPEGTDVYRLGRLKAGETKLVTFSGHGALPQDPAQLGGQSLDFAHPGQDNFHVAGSAAPGQRLIFHLLLHNPGWKGVQPGIRVSVTPHARRGFVAVDALASLFSEEEEQLGGAIVNAVGTKAITLHVLPGTTRLWGYRGRKCHGKLEFLHKLPDGITQGGVNVGLIGGFRPRDPCAGGEFTRGVEFAAKVSRAR